MVTWQQFRKGAITLLAILAAGTAIRGYSRTRTVAHSHVLFVSSGRWGNATRISILGKSAAASDLLSADPSGWVDITPRNSLEGWTRLTVPPGKALDPINQWSLDKQHGTLVCEGNHGHEWLRYDHELVNFLLHVEWRFEKREGLKGYNSGVFVRNDFTGRVWHQAQVGEHSYIFGQTLVHGELTPIIDEMWKNPPPAINPLHPIGEWNSYEIRCDGPKIALWVNGQFTDEFDALEVPKGYFGLEAEGFRIEFRNIKLKSLP